MTGRKERSRDEDRYTISFLGPLGTYSHQATTDYFGSNVDLLPQERIIDVFNSITNQTSQFGLVPIENSSIGSVFETMQELRRTELSVRGLIGLKIGHALLGPRVEGRRMAKDDRDSNILESIDQESKGRVKKIYSHEQGIGQCIDYLSKHYPQAEIVSVNSTAQAARQVVQDHDGDDDEKEGRISLAICSIKCAEVYGLDVWDQNIQDGGHANTTRFVVLSLSNRVLPDHFPISEELKGYQSTPTTAMAASKP